MEEQFRDLKISTVFPCEMTAKETENGVIELSIRWEGHPDGDGLLRVDWELPLVDMQFSWNPDCRFDRAIHPEWDTPTESMISSSAPVWSYYNASGINRLTFALSDAKTRIKVQAGVKEKGTLLIVRMSIPIDLYDRSRTYRVCLYRDTESVSFAEALRRVTAWWENSCGMKPMPVPDAAKEPLYSCWYSYHQTFKADEVEAECALAAQCGMNTVIVDDGWQTEDDKGGYAYCGDWEVAPGKIPDMKQHVAKVHAAGLKYMLWYSVPFVGRKSRHWEEFKDKILGVRTWWDTGILDPRYPSVREFIIQNYAAAIKNWDLDGLKLDFIDSFAYTPMPEPTPEMDYTSVEEAVERLMTDVMKTLRAIKPDIMIEFRQHYIGPVMRTYGNMFRVLDCPGAPLSNRVGSIDLRLISGNTAIHSDMLTWNNDDTKESVALQLMSIIFAVPQISVKIEQQNAENKAVLCYWLNFIRTHRDLLLDAPLEVESPQQLYPLVRAAKDHRSIIALYQERLAVRLDSADSESIILNANYQKEMIVTSAAAVPAHVTVRDCMGNVVEEKNMTLGAVNVIAVPACGIVEIKK